MPLSHAEWQLSCHEFSLVIHLDCTTIVLEQHFYLLRAKGSTEKHAFICEYLLETRSRLLGYIPFSLVCVVLIHVQTKRSFGTLSYAKLSTQLSVAQPPLYLSTATF